MTYLRVVNFERPWKRVMLEVMLKLLHWMDISYPSKEFEAILLRKCQLFQEFALGQTRKYVNIHHGDNCLSYHFFLCVWNGYMQLWPVFVVRIWLVEQYHLLVVPIVYPSTVENNSYQPTKLLIDWLKEFRNLRAPSLPLPLSSCLHCTIELSCFVLSNQSHPVFSDC